MDDAIKIINSSMSESDISLETISFDENFSEHENVFKPEYAFRRDDKRRVPLSLKKYKMMKECFGNGEEESQKSNLSQEKTIHK
jgi:putative lipase involved disintegration of autophagic bodies